MSTTKIEWAEESVNTIGGCTNASPGCDRCYSRGMSHRFGGKPDSLYNGVTINQGNGVEWTGKINTNLGPLEAMRDKPSKLIFMNSMSDWCHPRVSGLFIAQMFDEMARQKQHTFMLLTKRPGRMAALTNGSILNGGHGPYPLLNVWMGTSVESDDYCWRVDQLRESKATIKFLSLEPLLGPLPSLDLTGIDYVILGGESGPGARPMHPQWARDIRDRCIEAGIPFHFKQHGSWISLWEEPLKPGDKFLTKSGRSFDAIDCNLSDLQEPHVHVRRVGKKKAGRLLDFRTWDEMPERVTA